MSRDRNTCYSGSESFIGLSEFWDCLDKKQKKSLLTVHRETILEEIICETCKELLICAMEALDAAPECKLDNCNHDQASSLLLSSSVPSSHHHHSHGPSGHSLMGILLKSPSGYFASSLRNSGPGLITTPGPPFPLPNPDCALAERGGYELFSHVQPGGAFEIDPVGNFSRTVCGMSSSSMAIQSQPQLQKKGKGAAKEGSGNNNSKCSNTSDPPAPPPPYLPPPCYCRDKYRVRFVDMLTYPRPIRKFKMLLDKTMRLALLREMMAAEVGIEVPTGMGLTRLVLMAKGRTLPCENDHLSLEQLGFKNNIQVIVSKVLGEPPEENRDADEKNKQFVGDLLFGHANNDAPTQPGSLVESYKISHGYQVLGRSLELAGQNRVWRGYLAELNARANERALLASLLEEEEKKGKGSGDGSKEIDGSRGKSKSKARKQKKKEKEKKKKEELARKKKEDEDQKLRQRQERERLMKEKIEAERKAKEEARKKQLEAEEKLWWEAQIKKHSPSTIVSSQKVTEADVTPKSCATTVKAENSKQKSKRRQTRKSTKQPHSSGKSIPSTNSSSPLEDTTSQSNDAAVDQAAPNISGLNPAVKLDSVTEQDVDKSHVSSSEHRAGDVQSVIGAGGFSVEVPRPNFCSRCGVRFLMAANFCSHCGAPVVPPCPPPQPVSPVPSAGASQPMGPGATTRSQDILPFFAALHTQGSPPVPQSASQPQPSSSPMDDLVPDIDSLSWKGGRLPLFEQLRTSSSSPTLGPVSEARLPPPLPEELARNESAPEITAAINSHRQMAQFVSNKPNLSQNTISYLSSNKNNL